MLSISHDDRCPYIQPMHIYICFSADFVIVFFRERKKYILYYDALIYRLVGWVRAIITFTAPESWNGWYFRWLYRWSGQQPERIEWHSPPRPSVLCRFLCLFFSRSPLPRNELIRSAPGRCVFFCLNRFFGYLISFVSSVESCARSFSRHHLHIYPHWCSRFDCVSFLVYVQFTYLCEHYLSFWKEKKIQVSKVKYIY